jgi:hypothetical protein
MAVGSKNGLSVPNLSKENKAFWNAMNWLPSDVPSIPKEKHPKKCVT